MCSTNNGQLEEPTREHKLATNVAKETTSIPGLCDDEDDVLFV